MTTKEYTDAELKKLKDAYKAQRCGCKRRKDRQGTQIEMRMTFDQWLAVWEESGKLHLRGAGKGRYCMSRLDDLGHYEEGNIAIILTTENCRQGHLGRPSKIKGRPSPRKGMPLADEHRAHVVESLKRHQLTTVVCPHCGRTGQLLVMHRHHFDHCPTVRLKALS
ncbi:hypothetical protein [Roseateles albus]|uniref:HNH endonuclease n=1 Tax=Roseateles albus TaxID=2987525 RepID=A0ABT5KI36_9BURK|nr:hypothetical protein [Roseateles albus]MDC8773572.1 hypothetical protein [Roseateles albus]